MDDTAQLETAAETELALAEAAAAFKEFDNPGGPARDDQGRFAAADDDGIAEADDGDGDEPDPEAADVDEDDTTAADEAQPLPPSWPADKADLWEAIPAEARQFIAARDADQLRMTNAKLQESANARKAAEASQAEANANRTQYAEAIELMVNAIVPVKPDPRAYGAGTEQYDSGLYELARVEYDEQVQALAQLQEQLANVRAQERQEADNRYDAAKRDREAKSAPLFLADVPELTDPAKAETALRGLIDYAVEQGIAPETFAPANHRYIESAEMHILWKAREYDKLRPAGVQAQPKPKPAGPAVKPGVSSSRSAARNASVQRDMDRLAREGSIEAGAAALKHFMTR